MISARKNSPKQPVLDAQMAREALNSAQFYRALLPPTTSYHFPLHSTLDHILCWFWCLSSPITIF